MLLCQQQQHCSLLQNIKKVQFAILNKNLQHNARKENQRNFLLLKVGKWCNKILQHFRIFRSFYESVYNKILMTHLLYILLRLLYLGNTLKNWFGKIWMKKKNLVSNIVTKANFWNSCLKPWKS